MILTEEQIAERALKWYPKKKNTMNDSYVDEEDIRQRERAAYILACRDTTTHYRELIEAGMKWKELLKRIETTTSYYTDEDLRNRHTRNEMYYDVADQVRMMTKYEINW